MAIRELLESIGERVGRAGVSMVFGEPRVVGTRTVIPVASVSFGFGAGGGESAGDEGEQPTSSGGGGGGGGKATPVAIIEVSDEGTHVLPIVDITRIRLAGFALPCPGSLGPGARGFPDHAPPLAASARASRLLARRARAWLHILCGDMHFHPSSRGGTASMP